MADINITHSWADGEPGGGSGGGASDSSADRLGALLERLEASMDRLNLSLALFAERIVPGLTPDGSGGSNSKGAEDVAKTFWQNFKQEMSKQWGSMGPQMVGTVVAGATITAARYMNNKANQIQALGGLTGEFISSNLRGEASQNIDSYIKGAYASKSQYEQNQNTNFHEGMGATLGALVTGAVSGSAALMSAEVGAAIGTAILPGVGTVAGSLIGGAVGYLGGSYAGGAITGGLLGGAGGKLAASSDNADTQIEYAIKAQMAANDARAADIQWQNSYSRWGNPMTNTDLGMPVNGSSLQVPIDNALKQMYGPGTKNEQNYNQVTELAPYLTTDPLSPTKTGDLGQAIQNFKQAGYDIKDLGKISAQSAQYVALGGKNINEFSSVAQKASQRFGALFSTDTMQTALNLQMLGYTQDQSQNIAFQSQFNPNQQALMANYRNQTYSSYYRKKALSGVLEYDVNLFDATGGRDGMSEKVRQKYKEALESNAKGKPNAYYLSKKPFLEAAGEQTDVFASGVNHVEAGTVNTKGDVPDAGKNPAEEIAEALRTGLSNITNMTVNAQNVMIMNNGQISTVDTPGRWKENINRTFAAPDIDTSTFSPSAFGQLQRERNSQVQSQQDEAVKGLYVIKQRIHNK